MEEKDYLKILEAKRKVLEAKEKELAEIDKTGDGTGLLNSVKEMDVIMSIRMTSVCATTMSIEVLEAFQKYRLAMADLITAICGGLTERLKEEQKDETNV